ncbi:MAG TPA: DUF2845 domain-containing protein [Steroidobacteraceae bacterium]
MRYVLVAIVAVLACPVAHGETMRCGSSLVDETATLDELLAKCGEPARREHKVEDVWARNANGGTRVVGQTQTEYLTYDRGSQAAPMLVTVVDGKIRSIERVR